MSTMITKRPTATPTADNPKHSNKHSKSNSNSYSYNPVLQTEFDLNPLTSSTPLNLDDVEVVELIGTTHSRKGKYIRQTWRQTCCFGLLAKLLLLGDDGDDDGGYDDDDGYDDDKYKGDGSGNGNGNGNGKKSSSSYDAKRRRRLRLLFQKKRTRNRILVFMLGFVLVVAFLRRRAAARSQARMHKGRGGSGGSNDDDYYDDDEYIHDNASGDMNGNGNGSHNKNSNEDIHLALMDQLKVQDYTNLHPRTFASSYLQKSILGHISKSCLVQYSSNHLLAATGFNGGSTSTSSAIGANYTTSDTNKCDNPKCPIQNPFVVQVPESNSISNEMGDKHESSPWRKAHDLNIQLIDAAVKQLNEMNVNITSNKVGVNHHSHSHTHSHGRNQNQNPMLDIVFYGDSMIEEWNGRWLGTSMESKQGIKHVFDKYFHLNGEKEEEDDDDYDYDYDNNHDHDHDHSDKNENDGTHRFEAIESSEKDTLLGLALGIAGDTTNDLLYRIQSQSKSHNSNLESELPDDLQSKVFWIMIGTNDLSSNCSEDVVILGILSIVHEIRLRRPNSIVVINGLLPRTDQSDGRLIGVDDNVGGDNYNYNGNGHGNSNSNSNYNSTDDSNNNIFDYWPSIQVINYELKQYARRHEKVEFFDPSHLFLASMGNQFHKRNELFLMKELQDDYLHPTALGHEIWAEAIIDYFVSDLDTPENLRKND